MAMAIRGEQHGGEQWRRDQDRYSGGAEPLRSAGDPGGQIRGGAGSALARRATVKRNATWIDDSTATIRCP
jgi:hypothetical protein